MLRGVFRTKEGKIILSILVLISIIVGIFTFINYTSGKKQEEQAVMAEKYLNEGNYEQAVDAYMKALSMKNSDKEFLTLGLADAYVGVDEYDKALEALRACYQKTSGVTVKEKIEEVTSKKMDYDYLQSISRADIYFSNKEYDKAIAEFEKAKSIKSKEVTSYQKIAEAYIEKGEYSLAREEVVEGLSITKNKDLNHILDIVDSYQTKKQYDSMVEEAAEYITQENYEDGIATYEAATALMPEEEPAYDGMAKVYIAQGDYQKAINLLQDASKLIQSKNLNDLLIQATDFKEAEEKRKSILSNLFKAAERVDINEIKDILSSEAFIEIIASDTPVYYSNLGEGEISNGRGLIIYNGTTIYSGIMKDSARSGNGIYFSLTEDNGEKGYYYYDGEWSNDFPNGTGKTEEETTIINEAGEKQKSKTVTDGTFYNSVEYGAMHKYFYLDEEETGDVMYSAQNGIPTPLFDESGQPVLMEDGISYAIGMLYMDNQLSGEYYSVEPDTIWGVKPFLDN